MGMNLPHAHLLLGAQQCPVPQESLIRLLVGLRQNPAFLVLFLCPLVCD